MSRFANAVSLVSWAGLCRRDAAADAAADPPRDGGPSYRADLCRTGRGTLRYRVRYPASLHVIALVSAFGRNHLRAADTSELSYLPMSETTPKLAALDRIAGRIVYAVTGKRYLRWVSAFACFIGQPNMLHSIMTLT